MLQEIKTSTIQICDNMQKFSEYTKRFFGRLKNRIKNAGADLSVNDQFLKGEGFPEYLINIQEVNKPENEITYTKEDTKGNIVTIKCSFEDWYQDNEISWADSVDSKVGSGELVWRMFIDNRVSNIEVVFSKGTILKGTRNTIETENKESFFIKKTKQRDNYFDCYVYKSTDFSPSERYDVYPFSTVTYRKYLSYN